LADFHDLPDFSAFEGATYDADRDEVILEFSSSDATCHRMHVRRSVLGALVTALLDQANQLAATTLRPGQESEEFVFRVHDAGPMSLPDATAAVAVQFVEGIRIVVQATDQGAARLRTALAEAERLGTVAPDPAAKPH
jgi:hypothetical protein